MAWRSAGILILGLLLTLPVQAERVFKRVDEQGNVTYGSRPGGDGGNVEQYNISGGEGPSEDAIALDRASQYYPVTLYAIKKCKPCDQVREQLGKRRVPFTEKDPTSDKALYKEFQDIGATNVVPVIKVGDSVVAEYTKDALDAALDNAGYPKFRGAPEGQYDGQQGGTENPSPANDYR